MVKSNEKRIWLAQPIFILILLLFLLKEKVTKSSSEFDAENIPIKADFL